MPDTAALARRYRRLLVAYPRAYRRARGAEIVDTMLDAAEEGHPTPTVRAAVDLVGGGLRARLGRPRSRLVVPLSIVTAILVGLLASAIGYRLAWQARSGPLPSNAEASRIAATAMDGDVLWTQRDDFVFGWSGRRHSLPAEIALWPFSLDLGPDMEDSDLYDGGSVWVESARRTSTSVPAAARDVRQRLRADGWQVSDRPGPYGTATSPALVARKGGYVLLLDLSRAKMMPPGAGEGGATPYLEESRHGAYLGLDLQVFRATPSFVWAGRLGAGVLAAVLAWFAFGWFSRRTEGSRGAWIAYGVLVLALLPSSVAAARSVGAAPGGGDWLPSAAPISAILDQDPLLDLVAFPALLVLVVLALVPRHRTEPEPAGG
jgi:hypothetical protein